MSGCLWIIRREWLPFSSAFRTRLLFTEINIPLYSIPTWLKIPRKSYLDKMPECGVNGCKGEVASWTVTEACKKRVVDENGVGGDCGITKTGTAKACLKCNSQHGTKMGKCPRLKH